MRVQQLSAIAAVAIADLPCQLRKLNGRCVRRRTLWQMPRAKNRGKPADAAGKQPETNGRFGDMEPRPQPRSQFRCPLTPDP